MGNLPSGVPMIQKFRPTATSKKQLDFFSLFDSEEEDEIVPIVEMPLEQIYEVYVAERIEPSDEVIASPVMDIDMTEDDEIQLETTAPDNQYELPPGHMLHVLNQATEGDFLYTLDEYNAELGGLVINWSADDVFVLYNMVMEESFEVVKQLTFSKNLYSVDEYGQIQVNPILEAETNWYMSESFELACATQGLDAVEFRDKLKPMLYEATHCKYEMDAKRSQYLKDKEVVFHACSEGMGWDIFFDDDYFMQDKKLAIKWTDQELFDVYKLAFYETLDLFENLVTFNRITYTDAQGWAHINPSFEREIDWIESEAFEIIGNHLGYDVAAVRKQVAATCTMHFN